MPTNKNQQSGQRSKQDSQQTREQQGQGQAHKQHGQKSSDPSRQNMGNKSSQRSNGARREMEEINTDEE